MIGARRIVHSATSIEITVPAKDTTFFAGAGGHDGSHVFQITMLTALELLRTLERAIYPVDTSGSRGCSSGPGQGGGGG